MKVKSFVATIGLGMVAGAATMLMIPRHSQAYRIADDAAHAVKEEAAKLIDRVSM